MKRRGGQAEVPTRLLGSTGVRVSMVGLGGYHVGLAPTVEQSVRLVRSAIDRGVTFLDNCWDYNEGESELRMGKALGSGYRARAFLMTKLDGRTRKAATEQLEQSLRRLRVDTIDLVQVHEVIRTSDPARVFSEGGCMEALVAARQAGKLRFIGFTGHKAPRIHLSMLKVAQAHGVHFDAVQLPLNVLDAHFRSFEHQVLPVLVEQGIGVLGMKSMGSGSILESRVASPEECLRYAFSLPTSVVITGCESMAVLEQAIAAATRFRPLLPRERAALLARTRQVARGGEFEPFKTSKLHDGTSKTPRWLEGSRL